MKLLFSSISLFTIIIGLNSCKIDYVDALKVENNSNDTLVYTWSTQYPDTSIGEDLPSSVYIFPRETKAGAIPKVDRANFNKGIVEIFLFNRQIVRDSSWSTIRSKYLTLKRYDLSFDSLNKLNNTIVYP